MYHPTATRWSDMDPSARLVVMQQDDGDVIVVIRDSRGNHSVEFCTLTGGGKSYHTRAALQALKEAMIKDEIEHPQDTPEENKRREST